jgi:general nucleoside transport system ATP-binding protein
VKLELRGISKRYGSTQACDNIDLAIEAGEVLALLGENGAGKSTLMKVLYGVERADSGDILRDGQRVSISSPGRALALGIGMVFQQFSLIPAFTVAESLSLGASDLPFFAPLRSQSHARAIARLNELLPGLDPRTRVGELGVGEKQLVELCKVLSRGARVLILDEPTSVLSQVDAELLWLRIRQLARAGHSVILITHKLDDVAACADRVVVLRAGRVVHETRDVTNRPALVRAMLGGETPEVRPRGARGTAARFTVSGLSAERADVKLDDIHLQVHAGEILGVAGVTGNGQELLSRALVGMAPRLSGRIELDGEPIRGNGDGPAVGYVPEQPLVNGCASALSVLVNLCALDVRRLPFWLAMGDARRDAEALMERFDVRPRDLQRPVGTLSGGNVQKLVVARELSREPNLIVACYPTMGLDVAAAAAVLSALIQAAERGAAVVWISEDLESLLAHADRIGVLFKGALRGPVVAESANREQLGAWMTGAAA